MIAGANGSGKSTLLRVLATAIRPDGGRATIGGRDLVAGRDEIRPLVALLGHATYLYDSLTALENLSVVTRFLGRGDAGAALARVGLDGRADDIVTTFSAGMRKRLSLARVLLQSPRLVLLDEPYGALDPAGFGLIDVLVREWKSQGATILMATHQIDHVTPMADRSILLDEGRTRVVSS